MKNAEAALTPGHRHQRRSQPVPLWVRGQDRREVGVEVMAKTKKAPQRDEGGQTLTRQILGGICTGFVVAHLDATGEVEFAKHFVNMWDAIGYFEGDPTKRAPAAQEAAV